MGTIGFNRPTGKETIAELADMVASMQKIVEHLSRNINSKNVTEIGGWSVDMDRIASLDGDVGMSSAYTGLDDVRFWAGSTIPETAPWRVHNSGKSYLTGAYIQSGDAYPRVVIDPSTTLFGAYSSINDFININSFDVSSVSPSIYMQAGSFFQSTSIYHTAANGFNIRSRSPILIDASGYNTTINKLEVPSFYNLTNGIGGSLGFMLDDIINDISDLSGTVASLSTALAGKSNIGHTHSGSVTTADHNHGNLANATSGGGTYYFTVY